MLGPLVVAMVFMGLASALSMGVSERTGEIGVLFGWLVCQGLLAFIRREAGGAPVAALGRTRLRAAREGPGGEDDDISR